MSKWSVCDVCGCRYAQALMPNGKLSTDKTCPASKLDKNRIDREGDVWKERIFKHTPQWRE